jgi:hypothetical protein
MEEIKYSADAIRGDSQSTKAAGHLQNAQSAFDMLRNEYVSQHERVGNDQTEFEIEKKNNRNPDLDAHWTRMLAYLTETNKLLISTAKNEVNIDERSRLLDELGAAVKAFNRL